MPQLISGTVIDVYPFCAYEGEALYLNLLRTPGLALGNTWQAVHGRIEKRETAVKAAAREVFAQTGIQPLSLWNIDYVNTFFAPEEDSIYLIPSIGALLPPETEVHLTPDHVSWDWVSVATAMEHFLWVGQKVAVHTLHEEIASKMASGGDPNPFLQIAPALYSGGRRFGR